VNLKTKLTMKFMSQVFLLFGIVCAIGVAFAVYITVISLHGGAGTNPVLMLKSMPAATSVNSNIVTISPILLENVKDAGGWIQVLNGQGQEVFQYHRPDSVPSKYAPGLLLEYRAYPEKYGFKVYSWYDRVDGQDLTWLLGVPYRNVSTLKTIAPYLLIVLVFITSIVVTIVIALLFGRRLGAPLLHMMRWLQGLGQGVYEEPLDTNGAPESRLRGGELKRPFRLYKEVISALIHLSSVLNLAQTERKRLEQTREEWITGVSHDLKTPLSSVKGYGDLLAATQYDWSAQEVRQFGSTIVEKAMHMQDLIEDLGLTFRLKNEGLPLVTVPIDVIEMVRRSVIDLVNRPNSQPVHIAFESSEQTTTYPLDGKLFTRALGNLLANAELHNPANTKIVVRAGSQPLAGMTYPGILIEIADDGKGLDEETVLHLFDRYYRGTNTSERDSQGSGLGCAIAKQLIEAHGGTVEVYSTVGIGTTFYISLPPKN